MKGGKLTITLEGEMGKDIEIVYTDENPDKIKFIIKSNRGNIKDTITFETEKVVHNLEVIKKFYSLFKENQ